MAALIPLRVNQQAAVLVINLWVALIFVVPYQDSCFKFLVSVLQSVHYKHLITVVSMLPHTCFVEKVGQQQGYWVCWLFH